jgi:hypothetical protein
VAKKAHRQQTQPLVTRRLWATSWIVVGFFLLIPVGCAVAAVVFASAGPGSRSEANAYNAAPTCAPDGPLTRAACRYNAPAVVQSALVVRSGKSTSTSVSLLLDGDLPRHTTLSGDQSGALAAGTQVTVTLWVTSIAQIADGARTWTTKDSPIYRASNDVAALVGALAGSLVSGRILAWARFERRIVPHRFALADIALVLSAGTVAVLAAVHAAAAAAYLTLVAVALLAASVTVWPRLAWVRRPAL